MTREELNAIRGYVSNIQAIKDAHITDKLPINYGTICTITANGWKLIEELKALEQEPCECCEDCIRRSDVGLTDFEIVMCNGDYKEGLKMLLNKIEKAPSVTSKPKVGHWTKDIHNKILCSNCGKLHDVFDTDRWFEEHKYCYSCGARMIEPQTESEK